MKRFPPVAQMISKPGRFAVTRCMTPYAPADWYWLQKHGRNIASGPMSFIVKSTQTPWFVAQHGQAA